MNGMARPIAGYLLLFILFGVSSGFRVFSHICLMSGERGVTGQEEISDCCAKELPPAKTTLASNCCIEEAHFIKFDYTASTQEVLTAEMPAESASLPDLSALETTADAPVGVLVSLPPPRTANARLAYISVFRI